VKTFWFLALKIVATLRGHESSDIFVTEKRRIQKKQEGLKRNNRRYNRKRWGRAKHLAGWVFGVRRIYNWMSWPVLPADTLTVKIAPNLISVANLPTHNFLPLFFFIYFNSILVPPKLIHSTIIVPKNLRVPENTPWTSNVTGWPPLGLEHKSGEPKSTADHSSSPRSDFVYGTVWPKFCMHFSSPVRATCLAHLILLDLITLINFVKSKVYEARLCAFFSSLTLLPPSYINILLNILFPVTFSVYSYLRVKDTFSHPYKRTGKIV